MIKKAKNILRGVKATTDFSREHRPHKHHRTIDSQDKIDTCLNCTKPASKCKGDCYGRSH
jgi:phosphopantetheine adenylyltransferase